MQMPNTITKFTLNTIFSVAGIVAVIFFLDMLFRIRLNYLNIQKVKGELNQANK